MTTQTKIAIAFNWKAIDKQVKAAGKESLLVRQIEDTLYITNRHWMIKGPVQLVEYHLSKTLLGIFGARYVTDRNVMIQRKTVVECTATVDKILPTDESQIEPAELIPLVFKYDDKRKFALVRHGQEIKTFDADYAEMVDDITGISGDMIIACDKDVMLGILRFRTDATTIDRVKSYFR